MRGKHLAIVFGLGLGLILAILCQIGDSPAPASAAPAAELHVCPSGCDYSSVQAAVDAASEGDVVKVATGTYSDLHVRPRADVMNTGVVTQVVYLSKTLSIQGGYTTSNWTSPDPEANPTTLDALGQGRALYITGDINPSLEGLRLTGGDATGLGGWLDPFGGDADSDAGGGLYVISATATIQDNHIYANTAPREAGGAALLYSHVSFSGNVVSGNTATESTGGLLMFLSDGTISGNTISGNTADRVGGLELWGSHATVEGNTIADNTSMTYGCGGVRVFVSRSTLRGNVIRGNTAGEEGGGLCLQGGSGDEDWLISNVIADNQAGTGGSGLDIWSEPHLLHNTFAGNSGGDGSAIYLRQDFGDGSFVVMTNTIVADQDVGIRVTEGCTLTAHSILWYNTPITITQPGGTIPVPNQLTGDPGFVDPDNGDYHIGASSPARDAGVDAGVHMDLDGEWRPMAWAPDLGADEYPGPGLDVSKQASQALANAGEVMTYTIVLTSAGEETASGVVLTDTLDAWQRPVTASASQGACTIPGYDWGGAAICTPGSMPPGTTVWMTLTAQVSTSVAPGQELADTVVAQGDGTAAASAGTSVQAHDCHVRINEGTIEYTTVQAAVDAAGPGDVVKVAGTCLGVNTRAGHRQQVYLDKSLTIQGGYTTSDWTTPDPEANPTTLDALGQGHVLYVTEPVPGAGVNATVKGLRLTGGDTSWIDGDLIELCGGGVHVVSATITLEDNRIFANKAWLAGGLCLMGSEVTLRSNELHDNIANFVGGLHLSGSHGTLSGDSITGNRTTEWSGGGMDIQESQVTLDGLVIRENRSARTTGGLMIWNNSEATMTNSVVADNDAALGSGGLRIGANTTARLLHTTVARNSGGDGSGIYVEVSDPALEFSSLAMTNTIVADQSVGIRVTDGCTLTVNGILWHNTPVTVSQSAAAVVTVQNQHMGDAGFDADGYHLLPYSAAIDRGEDAGVMVDIDGEARPVGAGYDLGADEDGLVADLTLVKSDQPNPGVVGQPLTYTLAVGNNGPVGATGVVVTETLPAGATFVSASAGCERVGDDVVCSLGALAPDEQRAVSVHLTPDSTGQLIDLAVAQANEPDPNPANSADDELTAIVATPVLDPALTGLSPDHGPNDGPTAVTIEGQRFQDGATATLDGTSLGAVTFVDAQHLQATVPAGLTPGAYDLTVTNPDARSATLPGAFSVLAPGGPTVTSISPAQGPIDIPVTVDIRGLNFSSGMSATLHTGGSHVELPALIFVNSSRLFGTVPVSITPGVYTLTVSGPGGLSGALPGAYEALAPEVNDDLYALETDLWLDPPTVRQGDTPRIGLTLRRQGGEADLSDVQVEFYLEGGTPAFATTAPVLAPWEHVTVTVDWAPSPGPGEQTLYAVIDPLDTVEENDESNNVVSRSVTVLPPLPDTTPPVVTSVTINDGALVTENDWVSLKVEASDNPGGSGVAHLFIEGYGWTRSVDDWFPYHGTGTWLLYEGPGAECAWRLLATCANYVQVWAADGAGNISAEPAAQLINRVRPVMTILERRVNVFRVNREVGQGLQLRIATLPSTHHPEVNVGVWAPDGSQMWWASVPAATERELAFEASQDGLYQIEVEGAGWNWSYYSLSLVPLDGAEARGQRALADTEEWRTEPIVPPWDTPSRYVGLPSAPLLQHYIYLPLVLRLY